MDIPTHYATLELAPSAPDAVIRAAYKTLSLMHHPDKTLDCSPTERAHHASAFRAVHEAYNVLTGPSKEAYDAELKRHGNRVDVSRSTFHQAPTARKPRSATSTRPRVKLTSPAEKRMVKAKAERDLAYLRGQRAKRDMEDAKMDTAGLKVMQKIWSDLAEETEDDLSLQAYCAAQIKAYETKIIKRKQEDADWLNSMATPKVSPETPPSKKTSTSTPNAPRKAERAKQARAREEARKVAAEQASVNAKAFVVCANKDLRQQIAQHDAAE